jgi:hypothetical protein
MTEKYDPTKTSPETARAEDIRYVSTTIDFCIRIHEELISNADNPRAVP